MAIQSFKDIVDKRGYLVTKKDRTVFEREIGKGYFGMGISDMIEFMLYDSNDNPLPVTDDGKFVKYIHLDTENIRKYFIITNNPSNLKTNGADEYIINTERLIRDSGYTTGIFKTQTTLLNRRVGSENIDVDKLWIHEISPSRTEIRILPINDSNQNVYDDLETRLNIILKGGNFRDDTIYFIKPMIERIDTQDILNTFLTIKGNTNIGENYINLIKREFKIDNWSEFIDTIKSKFTEGAIYYSENKDWNINSNNYGKPLNERLAVELTVDKIVETLNSILIEVIDKYLPKQDIQFENILTRSEQVTLDEVSNILKTLTDGTIYDTNNPTYRQPIIPSPPPIPIVNPGNQNNPSLPKTELPNPNVETFVTKTMYAWLDSKIEYKTGNGMTNLKLSENEKITITYYVGTFKVLSGDVREVSKPTDVIINQNVEINPPSPVINTDLPVDGNNIFNGGTGTRTNNTEFNKSSFRPYLDDELRRVNLL